MSDPTPLPSPQPSVEPDTIRVHVLREVFPQLTFDEAVVLVGIVFDFLIICKTPNFKIKLKQFEARESAVLIASIYGYDCDQLFLAFYRRWSRIRNSKRVTEFLQRIRSHEYVMEIGPWPADFQFRWCQNSDLLP